MNQKNKEILLALQFQFLALNSSFIILNLTLNLNIALKRQSSVLPDL